MEIASELGRPTRYRLTGMLLGIQCSLWTWLVELSSIFSTTGRHASWATVRATKTWADDLFFTERSLIGSMHFGDGTERTIQCHFYSAARLGWALENGFEATPVRAMVVHGFVRDIELQQPFCVKKISPSCFLSSGSIDGIVRPEP